MTDRPGHQILYPTEEEIIAIHNDIVEEDEDADSGVINVGHVEFALQYIQEGHFGQKPETIHEKAVELLRLLSANHPFADGNKRTALNATWTFYALNGLYFDYGEEIKAILKLFAVMERMVDREETIDYFETITYPEEHDKVPTQVIRLMHVQKWEESFSERLKEFAKDVLLEDDVEEKDFDGLDEMVVEYDELTDSLIQVREEWGDEAADEFVEFVDRMEEERDLLMKELSEYREDLDEDDVLIPEEEADRLEVDLSEEEYERLQEEYHYDSDEMREKVRDWVREN